MVSEKIYIALLNYNGYKDTIACLESIMLSTYQEYQIIVVDNASTDESMKYLLSWAKNRSLKYRYFTQKESLNSKEILDEHIIFISSNHNGGFASGNNIAIRYALSKNDFNYIWLLNNDTTIENDTLEKLINYASKNDSGITGSSLWYYNNPTKIQSYGGYIDKFLGSGNHIVDINDLDKLEYVIGASLLIERRVIDKIGLLCEDYFLYYEDTDYCFNAVKNGFKLDVCIDSVVYHKEGGSTGSSKSILEKSDFSDFHSFKSRKIFLKKYLPKTYSLIYFQLLVYVSHRLVHGKFKNAISLIKAMRED